jgi:hypothetical protein
MPQKTSADLANIQQACAKEYRQFSGEAAPGQWTALPLPNGMTMPTHHGNHMQQPQHHPTPGQFNSLQHTSLIADDDDLKSPRERDDGFDYYQQQWQQWQHQSQQQAQQISHSQPQSQNFFYTPQTQDGAPLPSSPWLPPQSVQASRASAQSPQANGWPGPLLSTSTHPWPQQDQQDQWQSRQQEPWSSLQPRNQANLTAPNWATQQSGTQGWNATAQQATAGGDIGWKVNVHDDIWRNSMMQQAGMSPVVHQGQQQVLIPLGPAPFVPSSQTPPMSASNVLNPYLQTSSAQALSLQPVDGLWKQSTMELEPQQEPEPMKPGLYGGIDAKHLNLPTW